MSHLKVIVEIEERSPDERWPELVAYLFTRTGRLIDSKPVAPPEEAAKITTAMLDGPDAPTDVVVKVGPAVVDSSDLERYQPAVATLTAGREEWESVEIALPKSIWICWVKVRYIVTGTVKKLADGHAAPVCFGEVDVYDVDIGQCFWRLPDPIIERIRESLIDLVLEPPPVDLKELEHWPRWEDDWCGTKPKPPFPPKATDIVRRLEKLPPQWAFARKRYEAAPSARARMDMKLQRLEMHERQALLDREAAQGVRIAEILYTNTDQFRKLLLDRFLAFRFWLCWWPWIYWLWWPHCWWYALEKLGTATLQPDGSFLLKAAISICRKDIPDLWFVVRQKVLGVERVIYARHPVPCHTYWNHPSGAAVHLTVTDPLALACPGDPGADLDPAGLWVVPEAIGNLSLRRIYGTGGGSSGATPPPLMHSTDANAGLYDTINLSIGGSLDPSTDGPFGGTVGLRYLFSPALRANGVMYYRIKYRVNGAGDWTPLTREVVRHYSHYDPVTDTLEFPFVTLGPKSVGAQNNLFEIQPVDPPNKAAEPDALWYVWDPAVDLVNGYLDTTQLRIDAENVTNYGFADIKLELFDAAGTRLDPTVLGLSFKLPGTDDLWHTITTVDPATINPDLVAADPEAPAFQTFVFRLQADNRAPTAGIPEPTLDFTGEAAGDCGMMHYTVNDKKVNISYQATHPRQFAVYRFTLYRGPNALRTEEGRALVSGTFTYGEPVLPGDPDPKAIPQLLGPCTEAAFSENLYIWNLAFNGWSRVGPDANGVRAFALTEA